MIAKMDVCECATQRLDRASLGKEAETRRLELLASQLPTIIDF